MFGIPIKIKELIPAGLLIDLEKVYGEKHRFYHNTSHINNCLDEYSSFLHRKKRFESPGIEVVFSLLLHDSVYRIPSTYYGNEYESALFAREIMDEHYGEGSSKDYNLIVKNIQDNILATDHDLDRVSSYNKNQKLITSIDLAGLGHSWEEFEKNTSLIKKEYPNVSDRDFEHGRKKFLNGLLERDAIYTNDFFFGKYERFARENIKKYIGSPN